MTHSVIDVKVVSVDECTMRTGVITLVSPVHTLCIFVFLDPHVLQLEYGCDAYDIIYGTEGVRWIFITNFLFNSNCSKQKEKWYTVKYLDQLKICSKWPSL